MDIFIGNYVLKIMWNVVTQLIISINYFRM